MEELLLYHVGFNEIKTPELKIGRKNADFGQGFYTSCDKEFSERWARSRKGLKTILNAYTLSLGGLKIKRFERNEEWYDYIYRNRNGYEDAFIDYDVVIGPIANDTIYDTWGILTSGLIDRAKSIEILSLGNCYNQTVLKTENALKNLKWLSSRIISYDEILSSRRIIADEEEKFQSLMMEMLGDIIKD